MAFKKGDPNINRKGKKKGTLTKPRLSDYLSEQEVKSLISKALELASQGNETMLKFCLEQHFGKAMQPVEADFQGNITVTFDESFKKNAI